MRAALGLLAVLGVACGAATTPTVDAGVACVATFSGNFDEVSTSTYDCPRVEAVDGGWAFSARVSAPLTASTLTVHIPLGSTIGATSWTSADPVGDWEARSARDPGCVFVAGTQATPTGGFSLTLTAVDLATGAVHGWFDVEQSLHAVPAFNCGPGDSETLHLTF